MVVSECSEEDERASCLVRSMLILSGTYMESALPSKPTPKPWGLG